MAGDSTFNYDGLFAKSAPEPRERTVAQRAKYDFLVAYPDPESLPLDELVESLRGALQEEGKGLAVYPHPQGYPPLREFVASKLSRDRGMDVSADNIILGDGSGQHLQVISEALVDPGDVVLADEFVYGGTLATLRRFRADIRGVPCDEEGMQPDAVVSAIERASSEGKKAKLIYTIPTFQNPQGWTMSLERRKALVRLSQRYDVPILEDDCYVDLRYDGEPVPSIHSLDDTGRVLYVGSFSKIIAPGMRMGYMTGPPEFIDRAMAIKSGGGVNQLAALTVHRYSPRLDGHINKVKDILRVKRDAMLAALGENFGSAATWSRPDGGLYIWLRMPEGTDLTAVKEAAFSADVGFSLGTVMAADGASGRNYARLCYGYNTPKEIHEGIARLAEVFAQQGVLKA
jgi:2-aminoadipate transaminase